MIQYIALILTIKLRWFFILAGTFLMATFLYENMPLNTTLIFTGILLNIISLVGFALNIVKLTNTPINITDWRTRGSE